MIFLNAKTLSITFLVAALFPFEGNSLEIEDPQELVDGDIFKIQPSKKFNSKSDSVFEVKEMLIANVV